MKNKILPIICLVLLSSCLSKKASNSTSSTNNTSTSPVATAPVPTPIPTPTPLPTITPSNPDPLLTYAWHISNSGQSTFSNSGGVVGVDLNLNGISQTGLGVIIAVSDNGVEKDHEDLAANFDISISKNYNLNTPSFFGDPAPGTSAHGTAVTGIIAGVKNNGLGSAGIANQATIAGFQFIQSNITSSIMVDQANGIYHIFNYSWGGYTCTFSSSPTVYISQLEYGVKNLRAGRGAIYVKAAGNEYYSKLQDCFPTSGDDEYYLGNTNLEEDHSYPWYILTAAINANGISSSYSSPGSAIWISAPGGEFGIGTPAILTTDLSGCNAGNSQDTSTRNDFEGGSSLNLDCNYTSTMNGTSSATPMVSGVVALMLQQNPQLSWRDVKHILATTARKIDPTRAATPHPLTNNLNGHIYQLGWTTNTAGYDFHNWYGFGMVDASAAVNMAAGYNFPLGTFREDLYQSGNNLNLSIPDNSSTGVTNVINMPLNRVVESIQLKIDLVHANVGELGIELTSPSGTKSILMNINSGVNQTDMSGEVLLTNAFYGEQAAGNWTIKVIDGTDTVSGVLNHWELKVYGH